MNQEHVLHNDEDGAKPEEFKVVKITPHEEYSGRWESDQVSFIDLFRTFANDIAVVEFERRAEYKKGIQPGAKLGKIVLSKLLKIFSMPSLPPLLIPAIF